MLLLYINFSLQSLVNIVFDRVGRKDPVTKGMEIAVHWLGFDIDVQFWSQHISFFLVGCIIVTSIRGFILTLTRVSMMVPSLAFWIVFAYINVWGHDQGCR